jgi:thioredoxin 1
MPVVELQSTPLESLIPKTGNAIVDFYASWCGPCKMVAKVLHKISEDRGVTVIKVNIDEYPELATQYSINSLPTMLIYKDGNEINKIVGAVPEASIVSKL